MVLAWRARELAGADNPGLLAILGELNRAAAERHRMHWNAQTSAWDHELLMLRQLAVTLTSAGYGSALIVLEYDIPRRQRRPDVLLVTEESLLVLEFKVGATEHDAAARWQVVEYALDLRDFHSESSGKHIAGVVIATKAPHREKPRWDDRGVVVHLANEETLNKVVLRALADAPQGGARGDPQLWLAGRYRPTPNIIEAAGLLYRGHGVAEINHAYAHNLTETTAALVSAIDEAARDGKHVVCFVSGVPGAGKTLTGLDAVHDPLLRRDGKPAGVFLSGNGPLVKVIQEALVRATVGSSKKEARRTITTFVQSVHRFVATYASDETELPPERVVVFDEAQRAWSKEKMTKEKRGNFSEAEQMLEILERFPDWAVLIALVGGGQEIHDGEAGLAAWGEALSLPTRRPWTVKASPEALSGGTSVSGRKLFRSAPPAHVTLVEEARLHLSVSVRAPRAKALAQWVDAVLEGQPELAAEAMKGVVEFPLVGTRHLSVAKAWLRQRAADGQRAGLVASAGARRLRAYGIQLSTQNGQNSDIDQWFLADGTDVRSSSFLEVAATEFECQGLELDYVGLCWGDDLARSVGGWESRRFRGSSWTSIRAEKDREYLLNKYRVLLTRARKGMIIWVPLGSAEDSTRDPTKLDATWNYLRTCGLSEAEVPVTAHAVGPDFTHA